MPDEKSFAMRMSELIWECYPGVTQCDLEQSMQAAAEVSGVLGCLVAMIALDDADFEQATIAKISEVVATSSRTIRLRALANAREPGHA